MCESRASWRSTSPKLFNDSRWVVQVDRVYVKSVQPAISVASARLVLPGGREEEIIRDDTCLA